MADKYDEIIMIIILVSLLVLLLTVIIIVSTIKYERRQRKHLQEKEVIQTVFKEELLRTQIEIQEQTLKNISQEIHDNIGQTLSLVKLNLNTINLEQKENTWEKLINSKDLVSKAINDLRGLSKTLNTDTVLSGGLLQAIELELSMIKKAGIFETELDVSGTAVRVDPKKELILFRIVQEALSNIIKHSNASIIKVKAEFMEDRFLMAIKDNGTGFEYSFSPVDQPGGGSGLQNMSSRAHLIGGGFELHTSNGGTTIQISIPISKK